VLAGEEEVEGGRGDDDLGVGVDLGVVELVDNVLDRLNGAVPVGRASVSCAASCWGCGVEGQCPYILKLPPTKN